MELALGIVTVALACTGGLLFLLHRKGKSNIDLSQAIPLARRHWRLLAVYGAVWAGVSVVLNPAFGVVVLGAPIIPGMFLAASAFGRAGTWVGPGADRLNRPSWELAGFALYYLLIPPLAWFVVAIPVATLFLILGGVGFLDIDKALSGRWQGDDGTVLDIRSESGAIEIRGHDGESKPVYHYYLRRGPVEVWAWFWSPSASVAVSDATCGQLDLWANGRVLEFRFPDGSRKRFRRLPA